MLYFNITSYQRGFCVRKRAWHWRTLDLRYLGQNEPFLNAFDGFITKSRRQSPKDGKLVFWWKKCKMTTEIVQILDFLLRNEFQYIDSQSPCICKRPWNLNWSKWILFADIPIQILLTIIWSVDHSSRGKLNVHVIFIAHTN